MKLGSLFDGIGGFPLAWTMLGGTPVWASEIEAFPMTVTAARFPNMKQLGDVTKINGAEIEPVDVITFGSPCQDLSVAGLRKSLIDENGNFTRSGLFFEAIRIIKEMREATNGEYPKFIVWENVPGALSSKSGEDFRAVLREVCQVKDSNADIPKPPKGKWRDAGAIVGDGYSVAWRILDAQYHGVPQRRRRIFLISSYSDSIEQAFGDSAIGCAGEISFKRPCLRGDFEACCEPGQDLAPNFRVRTEEADTPQSTDNGAAE